jgi:xanthine dehydrogenase accessory factor
MRSLWPQLSAWLDAGESFALATVTAVSGSAPRAPGSCMAIMPGSSRFIGSVSSGCLDVEVVEAARAALRTGATQHLRFGPDGNPPWTDGLTCGGWIEVRIEPWWPAIGPQVRRWLELDVSGVVISSDAHHVAIAPKGATASGIDGSVRVASIPGSAEEDWEAAGDVAAFSSAIVALAKQRLARELPPAAREGAFLRTILRRPRLVIVGGVDVTVHLVALARELGFAVKVIDPRAAFIAAERFPVAPDQLRRGWPQETLATAALGPRDAALALTHDPKIDDSALLALLQTPVGYIGALGSTRSHASRLERLADAGADPVDLKRIHGPAGIHLGTPNAPGIALGIAAGLARWQAEVARAQALQAG